MENIMVWIWLAVTVIAIVVEIITPELVSLWFAIGGIVGIAFSFIPGLPYDTPAFAAPGAVQVLKAQKPRNQRRQADWSGYTYDYAGGFR